MRFKPIWRYLVVAAMALVSLQAYAIGEATGNILGSLENQGAGNYTVSKQKAQS